MVYDSDPPPSIFDKRDIRLVDLGKRIEPTILDDIEALAWQAPVSDRRARGS